MEEENKVIKQTTFLQKVKDNSKLTWNKTKELSVKVWAFSKPILIKLWGYTKIGAKRYSEVFFSPNARDYDDDVLRTSAGIMFPSLMLHFITSSLSGVFKYVLGFTVHGFFWWVTILSAMVAGWRLFQFIPWHDHVKEKK